MFRIALIFSLLSICSILYGQTKKDNASVILREEFIFPLQQEHVHGSSLVELPNGDFLVAWFQGSGERHADDVRINGARLKKGSQVWSKPFELADTPNLPDCNPVLFFVEDTLYLVWIAVQANQWQQSILRLKTSTQWAQQGAPVWNWQDNILLKPKDDFSQEVIDKLKTLPDLKEGWSEYAPKYDQMIVAASKDIAKRSVGWMTRIKPLILKNKTILLPLYSDGFNMSMVAISTDLGASWLPSLPIVGRGPIQPALAERKNGTIVAYMRDSGNAPNRIQYSESKDQGMTWSAAEKTTIPNTASVEIAALPDGRWAMLGNDIDDGRHQLRLYLSLDEGRSWNPVAYVEDDVSKQGSFSYPSLIVGRDGLLHISYSYHPEKTSKTIKYVVIDPSKISR